MTILSLPYLVLDSTWKVVYYVHWYFRVDFSKIQRSSRNPDLVIPARTCQFINGICVAMGNLWEGSSTARGNVQVQLLSECLVSVPTKLGFLPNSVEFFKHLQEPPTETSSLTLPPPAPPPPHSTNLNPATSEMPHVWDHAGDTTLHTRKRALRVAHHTSTQLHRYAEHILSIMIV